jgi:hypothetical protein
MSLNPGYKITIVVEDDKSALKRHNLVKIDFTCSPYYDSIIQTPEIIFILILQLYSQSVVSLPFH